MAQGGAFARYYRDSQILNVPLTFNNYAEVDAAREQLDPLIKQGLEDNGWVSFGLVDGGFAYIMSGQPVRSLDDLRAQKLWLPSGDSASANAAATLNLSPIVLNIGGVLTSLQTGAIDAFAAPPVAALTLQWYSGSITSPICRCSTPTGCWPSRSATSAGFPKPTRKWCAGCWKAPSTKSTRRAGRRTRTPFRRSRTRAWSWSAPAKRSAPSGSATPTRPRSNWWRTAAQPGHARPAAHDS